MRRVLSYARISVLDNEQPGLSLDAQHDTIRAYCKARDLELVEHIEDRGVSAGKPLVDRRGGGRLLSRLAAGDADGCVAVRLDRLFRRTSDALTVVAGWQQQGVALHLIDLGGTSIDTTTPIGELMLTMLAAVAQMERSLVRERTRAVMRHKKCKGEFTGGLPPFGFRADGEGRLVKDPGEQKALVVMRELRDAGESLRAIADILTAQRYPARGKRWYAMTVQRALKGETGARR